nr:hypothetical protein [uncultured Anaeromusa sp.]
MKKTFIPLLAIILVVAGYFGYQHYQTQQYIEKVMPLYRSMETLQGDQEKVFKEGGGKLYKDLIAECDRVKTASKDLKLRVAEVSPTTARASEINVAMLNSLDKLSEYSEAYGSKLQADLSVITAKKVLGIWSQQADLPFIGGYIASNHKKAYEEYTEARSKATEKTSVATTARAVYLSDAKFKVDELLSIKHPEQAEDNKK